MGCQTIQTVMTLLGQPQPHNGLSASNEALTTDFILYLLFEDITLDIKHHIRVRCGLPLKQGMPTILFGLY